MKKRKYQFWLKSDNEEQRELTTNTQDNSSSTDETMSNLIKMKEATKLLKASAPTVRKYARLGHYSEYKFGEKLVFYNKQEILDFILSRTTAPNKL